MLLADQKDMVVDQEDVKLKKQKFQFLKVIFITKRIWLSYKYNKNAFRRLFLHFIEMFNKCLKINELKHKS